MREDNQKKGNTLMENKWFFLVAFTIVASFAVGALMFYMVFSTVNTRFDQVWQSMDKFDEDFDRDEKRMTDTMAEKQKTFEAHQQAFREHFDATQQKILSDMAKKQDDFYEERRHWIENRRKESNEHVAQMTKDFEKSTKAMDDRVKEAMGIKPLPLLTGKESPQELERRASIHARIKNNHEQIKDLARNGLMSAQELKKRVPELSLEECEELASQRYKRPQGPIGNEPDAQ